MAYEPEVLLNQPAAVDISSTAESSYDEIRRSIGPVCVYLVEELHVSAQTHKQLINPVGFTIYDATGYEANKFAILNRDPYLKTNAMNVDLRGQDIVLNGRSALGFPLEPHEIVTLLLRVKEVSKSQELNVFGPSNFRRIQNEFATVGLFNEYADMLD